MTAAEWATSHLAQVQEYGKRTGRFERASIQPVNGRFPHVPFMRNTPSRNQLLILEGCRNQLLILEGFRFHPSDEPVRLMIPITDYYPFQPPDDVVVEGKPEWTLLLPYRREIPSPLTGQPSTILLWHFQKWNPVRDNLMTVVHGMRLLFQNWVRAE